MAPNLRAPRMSRRHYHPDPDHTGLVHFAFFAPASSPTTDIREWHSRKHGLPLSSTVESSANTSRMIKEVFSDTLGVLKGRGILLLVEDVGHLDEEDGPDKPLSILLIKAPVTDRVTWMYTTHPLEGLLDHLTHNSLIRNVGTAFPEHEWRDSPVLNSIHNNKVDIHDRFITTLIDEFPLPVDVPKEPTMVSRSSTGRRSGKQPETVRPHRTPRSEKSSPASRPIANKRLPSRLASSSPSSAVAPQLPARHPAVPTTLPRNMLALLTPHLQPSKTYQRHLLPQDPLYALLTPGEQLLAQSNHYTKVSAYIEDLNTFFAVYAADVARGRSRTEGEWMEWAVKKKGFGRTFRDVKAQLFIRCLAAIGWVRIR